MPASAAKVATAPPASSKSANKPAGGTAGGSHGCGLAVFGAGLFLTVALEVAFALLMARTLYLVEREGWLLAALRMSWKPMLGVLVVAVMLGALADWGFPQADTLVQMLHALRGH